MVPLSTRSGYRLRYGSTRGPHGASQGWSLVQRAFHGRRGGRVPAADDGAPDGQTLAPSPCGRSLFALLLWTVALAGAVVLVVAGGGMVHAGDVAEPVALA